MLLKGKSSYVPYIFAIFSLIAYSTDAAQGRHRLDPTVDELRRDIGIFGNVLLAQLEQSNANQNIIFSPLSIQTCLGMAQMSFMSDAPGLAVIGSKIHSLLQVFKTNPIVKFANRIYVNDRGPTVATNVQELLRNYFMSSVSPINFAKSAAAAQTINSWVESNTNHLVKDLIAPSDLSSETWSVMVNVIHFKGRWVNEFEKLDTFEREFYLDETNTVKIPVMSTKAEFRYGTFPALDATALEMPYQNSDLSMLVILPNTRTGLSRLEQKLKTESLSLLAQNMEVTEVSVLLPKFKTEFEMDVLSELAKLDVEGIFSPQADISRLLSSIELFERSRFVHKAVIEVNEEGAEAGSASASGINFHMGSIDETLFYATHPFVFYIKNSKGDILFQGNVKNFNNK